MVLFDNMNVNQEVEVKWHGDIRKGKVRYKGPINGYKGDWVGVELYANGKFLWKKNCSVSFKDVKFPKCSHFRKIKGLMITELSLDYTSIGQSNPIFTAVAISHLYPLHLSFN